MAENLEENLNTTDYEMILDTQKKTKWYDIVIPAAGGLGGYLILGDVSPAAGIGIGVALTSLAKGIAEPILTKGERSPSLQSAIGVLAGLISGLSPLYT